MNLETLQTIALVLSIGLYLALIVLVFIAIPAFRDLRAWLKGADELQSLVRSLRPTVSSILYFSSIPPGRRRL